MEIGRSGEDYLEAIYVLQRENGSVYSVDVARRLDFSKPSVSRAVGILREGGYLEMRNDGELALTDRGRKAAQEIDERHTVLTAFFTGMGVGPKTAEADACEVEHVISEETFARIRALQEGRAAAPATEAETPTPPTDAPAAAVPGKSKEKDKEDGKGGKKKKKKKKK